MIPITCWNFIVVSMVCEHLDFLTLRPGNRNPARFCHAILDKFCTQLKENLPRL